jgi:uncharacterized LabA/DUF88 family protein
MNQTGTQQVITYIDGFNLYYGLKSKYGRKYIWLNVEALSMSLLKQGQVLKKVKYFTAMIRHNPNKEKRQRTYISALETLPNTEIYYGKYLTNQHTCPNCGNIENIPSEKMTDVNIATHLLTDAFNNAFDVAIVISADSDLIGPIKMVGQLFVNKKVVVAFPPDRVSFDLKNAASAYFHIGRQKFAKNQFPQVMQLPNGVKIQRPGSWK